MGPELRHADVSRPVLPDVLEHEAPGEGHDPCRERNGVDRGRRVDAGHSFPATGDGSTPALWLDSVTHTGSTGAGGASASTPPVQFVPAPYNNRVDTTTDGLPPNPEVPHRRCPHARRRGDHRRLRPRLQPAALPQPQNNSTRCYPVRWTPEGASPRDDWFAKYVVARVTEADLVGRSATMATDFEYLGGAGWRYNDNPLTLEKHRTWSRYRGYEKVRVTRGNPQGTRSATTYQYFRGLDGDHQPDGATRRSTVTDSRGVSVDDSDQLAGFVREEITYNGLGGPEVSGTINDVHQRQTAADGPLRSYQIDVAAERTRTAVPGGERTTLSEYTYNDDGLVTAVSDLGDVSTPEDDQCRKTEYARDEAAWRLDLPSRQTTVAVAARRRRCSRATPSRRGGRTTTATLSASLRPRTLRCASRSSTRSTARRRGTSPPSVRRSTSTGARWRRRDALGRRSTTSFSPETGRPTTSTDTNPKGHRTRTTFSALRGQPTNVLDVDNNRPTDLTYDALGRLTGVWLPGRSRSWPDTRYRYLVRTDGTSWVATESLTAAGNYSTSYSLLDGFLRERQTQAPGWGGGRVFTSVEYDSRGLAVKATGPEHTTGDPGAATSSACPSSPTPMPTGKR